MRHDPKHAPRICYFKNARVFGNFPILLQLVKNCPSILCFPCTFSSVILVLCFKCFAAIKSSGLINSNKTYEQEL